MLSELIDRVQYIQTQCGGPQKAEPTIEAGNDFTRLCSSIDRQIVGLGKQIKERDELLGSSSGAMQAEQSSTIRKGISLVKGDVQKLETLTRQRRKKGKLGELDEESAVREAKVVEFWQRVKDVESLDRSRFTKKTAKSEGRESLVGTSAPLLPGGMSNSKDELLGGPSGGNTTGPSGGSFSPEEEKAAVDGALEQVQMKDHLLDEQLDQVSGGVQVLKDMALDMRGELKKQDVMMDELTTKVTNSSVHLHMINKRMKKTLEAVRGGEKILMDIILICVVLGIGGVIYQMSKK